MDIAGLVTRIILFGLLVFICLTVLYPLFWGLMTSLKHRLDFGIGGNNLFGFPNLDKEVAYNSRNELFKLANYQIIFEHLEYDVFTNFYQGDKLVTKSDTVTFGDLVLNSLLYCGIGALLRAFVPAIVAYVCAKYTFKFSAVVYSLVIINMTVPVVGTLPAELSLLRNLGIYDTWFMHIFQSFSFDGMYFLVFYASYQGLSNSYTEAAEIDGASQFKILTNIAIPLTIKVIFTIFLLMFIEYWNNYNNPLVYMPTHPTLAAGVLNLANRSQHGLDNITVKTASCMILAVPVFVVFVIFHEKIMGNVSMGGVKE